MVGLGATSQTLQNLSRTKQCTINLASEDMGSHVNALARVTGNDQIPSAKVEQGYRYVKDKFEAAGLSSILSLVVQPHRVRECPVQIEAELAHMHPMMTDDDANDGLAYAIELKIVLTHVRNDLCSDQHTTRINTQKWLPMIMSFQRFYGLRLKDDSDSEEDLPQLNAQNHSVLVGSDVVVLSKL